MPDQFKDLNLLELGAALRQGHLTAQQLAEECLRRAEASPFGAWRKLTPDRALAMARNADRLLAEDRYLGPLHGIPVGIKDNIDMQGEVSLAGLHPSLPLEAAAADAAAVVQLEQAGAVIVGRTHMTELAFTALGPSAQGTPVNSRDPARVTGGSSSGSAVAVAAREVPLAIGSDTGGSIRIPAAYTGISGLKPGAMRLDMRGVFPLSNSLDTVGPLATTIAEVEVAYAALDPRYKSLGRPGSRRAFVPETVLLDDLDGRVEEDFELACRLLADRDIDIVRGPLPLLHEIREARRYGSFAGWEAYRMYGELLRSGRDLIDVSAEILAYEDRDPEDYRRLIESRAALRKRFEADLADFDVVLAPTVACLPPLLSGAHVPEAARELDRRGLRNTQFFSFLGVPALAVPMGDLTSLSIVAKEGQENLIVAVGKLFEAARA